MVLRPAVESGGEAPSEAAASLTVEEGAADLGTETPADEGPDLVTIVGASSLGVVGLAGVVAGIVGIAGAGECLEMAGGTCIEERQTGWVGTGTYLGLGAAAIAGAVIWLIVGLSGGGGDEQAALRMGPNGELTWSF